MLFSEKLRDIRFHSKLSQEELAETLGVSTATISRIERGEQQPSFELTALLIQRLDICPEVLFGCGAHDTIVKQCHKERIKELDTLYHKLSAYDQKLFNQVLRAFV